MCRVGIFREEEGTKAGRGGRNLCSCPEVSCSAPNQSPEWHAVLADKMMIDHSENSPPEQNSLGTTGANNRPDMGKVELLII